MIGGILIEGGPDPPDYAYEQFCYATFVQNCLSVNFAEKLMCDTFSSVTLAFAV